ncbi:uncharacterized protein K02A2.6-like [Armigeres subalbatus]|uniref:uncharacterized protein K02A2.6-like n=1 Tax=Armigeres subalbatus TaxID=124917 RepID=UPI002ED2937E
MEEVHKHAKEYDKASSLTSVQSLVQNVTEKQRYQRTSYQGNRKCYNCNRPGHIAEEIHKCPAKNVTCFNCGMRGHFKASCRKRKVEEPQTSQKQNKKVCALVDATPQSAGLFFVNDGVPSGFLVFDVGVLLLEMVVDSGSPANIIRESTYQKLKAAGANIMGERNGGDLQVRLESFASDSKILFSCAFEAEIKTPGADNGVWTHFLVAPKGQTDLLSKATAFALGVLKIGYSVNQITGIRNSTISISEFPKIPNVALKIQVDEHIKPIVQAARRLPISMEADVEEVIQDLIDKKIIERAEAPFTWISPLVPVRKSDGKIRLCVDMRAANQAVIRENYPMPNIDTVITEIRKVTKLSNIDFGSAYHYIELELMLGIKSAPELF